MSAEKYMKIIKKWEKTYKILNFFWLLIFFSNLYTNFHAVKNIKILNFLTAHIALLCIRFNPVKIKINQNTNILVFPELEPDTLRSVNCYSYLGDGRTRTEKKNNFS